MNAMQIHKGRRYIDAQDWECLVTNVVAEEKRPWEHVVARPDTLAAAVLTARVAEGKSVMTVLYTVITGPLSGKECKVDREEFAGRMVDFADIPGKAHLGQPKVESPDV